MTTFKTPSTAENSFIKVSPVQLGGSITLASFVPLLIYAYKFGPVKGTLAGVILGLFNFIETFAVAESLPNLGAKPIRPMLANARI